MSIDIERKDNALIYYDSRYVKRIVDVVGTGVTKFIAHAGSPADDTTFYPSEFIQTVVSVGAGDSSVLRSTTSGTLFDVVTAANENDGVQIQLAGQSFLPASTNRLYFGAEVSISDATQSDFFLGLATLDTTLTAAHAINLTGDGLFFSKLDGSTTIAAKAYLNNTAVATANYDTAMSTASTFYEIYWDGETARFYIDNNLVTCVTASLPDSTITPSFSFKNGEAAAKTAKIKSMVCFQY